jgi:ribosome-binding protein aMBF1 (putative translation factor)
MVAGTIQLKGQRFVIVPEREYQHMRDLTREITEGDGPALPKPDANGNVPGVQYLRAGLARRIILRRRKAGLTQAQLARRAGIRAETLCRIEKAKMTPGTVVFDKIHRALEQAQRDAAADDATD